jgi:hypothetical protein
MATLISVIAFVQLIGAASAKALSPSNARGSGRGYPNARPRASVMAWRPQGAILKKHLAKIRIVWQHET